MAVSAGTTAQRAGVCAAAGFRAGAAAAGIRGEEVAGRLDLALIESRPPAVAAGVFTRNIVKAAPVVISQMTVRRGETVGAVVINSGNANACTGPQGFRDALRMCALSGDALEFDPAQVLVCSTGVIGRPMPMERVAEGIAAAAARIDAGGGEAAAEAIMTTDTRPKTAVAAWSDGGRTYTIGGMAKGSGMIHPDMATMLALLTCDAPVTHTFLQAALHRSVEATFNCMTVDGDTSTNDCVLLLANGAAGGEPIEEGSPAAAGFIEALQEVCVSLTEQIVADGEGATRLFRVHLSGAADLAQARTAARTVAGSPLVKTAIHGADPNWGRILAALGRSGAQFRLDRCRISIGGILVFASGMPAECDLGAVGKAFAQPTIDIDCDLGAGDAAATAWGCDLSAEYVHINADYTT